ncbi:MAG: PASTA domain-containing protein [Bacteroidales bacterium]|jgi:beta-lactam-binding protein with PASTA domain|nr:PASTA domain-containing protein [Bacteroidales bacterium]
MSKQKNGASRSILDPSRPGFHILMAIVVTAVIFILTILFLRLFTRHGREIEMPSYAGRSAQELTQHGRSEGFVFVVNDELYENGATPGTVLKQNPLPGEKVKRGRKVYLTVAAAEPPTIKMLELRDLSLRQAQIMIESQGLVLDKIIEKPSPYENVVLEVLYKGHSIAQGTPIKQGEKITLVVGKDIGDLPDSDSTNTESSVN